MPEKETERADVRIGEMLDEDMHAPASSWWQRLCRLMSGDGRPGTSAMTGLRGKPVPRATLWRRRAWLMMAFFVLAMAILASLLDGSVPSLLGNGSSSVPAGLFVSSQAPSDVLSLGRTLGVTPTVMTVYADGSCYCTYASPPSTSMTLMLGVGALTSAQATSIGQSLVAAGQSGAIIRIMWEQNQDIGGWFQDWNQLSLTASQYISTFQNIVTTMRSVPGQAFRFMWNPNGGTGNEAQGRIWGDTWPGSAYVNYVGVDQYDYSGYASNIQAVIAFAQSQGLAAAIPEWGLNGSDDPSYINGVADLVNNPANNFALQAYFSYDGGSGGIDSDITQFPQSQAAYTVDFGGASSSPSTTTTGTSPTSTTTSPAPTTSTTSPPPAPTTSTTSPPPSTTTTSPPPATTTTTATTAPPPATTTTTAPPSTTTTTAPVVTTPTGSGPTPTSATVTVVPEVGSSAQRLTATVSPATASGTVQFIVDGWVVGDAIPLSSDGTAVIALYLAVGPHLVDATYSGTPLLDSSAVATVANVGQAPSSLLTAVPIRIGSGQLYQLSATLSSAGVPLAGAAVWFSAAGSALCVATTDATGSALCSIDEGTTDVFSLATTGVTAAFGGDPTHLPASNHSPAPDGDNGSADIAPGARAQEGAASPPSTAPPPAPVSPASAAASDTPATLDAVSDSPGMGTGSAGSDALFALLFGVLLVGAATLGRRRLRRAEVDDHQPWR